MWGEGGNGQLGLLDEDGDAVPEKLRPFPVPIDGKKVCYTSFSSAMSSPIVVSRVTAWSSARLLC